MKALTIRTQEGIAFSIRIASPLSRFAALAIDMICVYTLAGAVTGLLQGLAVVSPDLTGALIMISTFVLTFGYWMILEWFWRGQTVGKRFLKLRVMDEQGLKLRFSQVVVRNLLRFVDSIPFFYLVGGLSCFFSRHGQRLGDLAANTIVVEQPVIQQPDLQQILPGKFNSFREYPHLAARLRHSVSPAEAGLILQALIRRDILDDDARLKLFAEIRAHVSRMVEFPAPVVEAISDEQYVRNVADVLFR